MSKKRSQSTTKKELGFLALLLAMVILGAIGWFWKDATGYPYRTYGMIWWATAVFVAFTMGLLYYALFVLPIAGNEGWAEGLRLLVRNYTHPPPRAEEPRRRRKPAANPLPAHLQDLPASFAQLGSGIVRSNHALALTKGSGFSRADGPGFVVLFNKETLAQTFDVRDHTRSQIVKANTRDGIAIELPIFVSFRVWRQEETIIPGRVPYPYDPEAIFQLNYAGGVTDKDTEQRWSDLVTPIAANLFVTEIARSNLDQLYERDSNGLGPLNEINRRIRSNLERSDRLTGIEILSVSAGIITLPESAREQRIKMWQTQRQHEIFTRQVKVDTEADLRLKRARAKAQIEIIESITQSITESRRSNVNLTEIVALRMIEALEEAVSDVTDRALVPQPVLASMVESSRQMLTWMDEEKGKNHG
ncbi:MAG: SPFH domain-containing protein [Chloroflexota bacterium]